MPLNPLEVFREAIRAVPAVKYALGVAGLLSVVAITKAFGLNAPTAVAGTIITLVLMVALLVFARLTANPRGYFKWPALIFMWASLVLVLATASLLFLSAFFRWPIDIFHDTTPAPSAAVDVVALSNVVQSQLESRDYSAAWDTVANASKSHPTGDALLPLQTKIAEAWIRNVSVSPPQKFADVVDKLLPPLYVTAQRPKGVDAADALAHIGWANFLKSRDGVPNLDVEGKYRETLQRDPDNPFAHAMWGHLLMTKGDHLAEAKQHFAAALKSPRERKFVRELQIAALQWVTTENNQIELIRVCNEMRKGNEPLAEDTRSRILSGVYVTHRDAILKKLDKILPADEHLATFQWLTQGIDTTKSIYYTFFLARLQEAVGNCETATSLYASGLSETSTWSEMSREGLERCRRKSPQTSSRE